MSSNTDKKKRKSARLAGLEPNPLEMVSPKVRKTNGLLTPHASFKDTEKNPGRSQNKRKDRATVHPPETEASTGEDDVKKDPETAKHSPIASTKQEAQNDILPTRRSTTDGSVQGGSKSSTLNTHTERPVRTPHTPILIQRSATLPNLDVPRPVDTNPSDHFIFFDLETTDAVCPISDILILEVAVRVTDKNFIPLDDGKRFFVHWPRAGVRYPGTNEGDWQVASGIPAEVMPDVVRQMHIESGLLQDLDSTPIGARLTLASVEQCVIQYLRRHRIYKWGIMAGAGVHFDRAMVRQHMPQLSEMFAYQVFDTTTLWHLVRRKFNRDRSSRFASKVAHRAMDDINGAIKEASFYSSNLFKSPGQVAWPANGI